MRVFLFAWSSDLVPAIRNAAARTFRFLRTQLRAFAQTFIRILSILGVERGQSGKLPLNAVGFRHDLLFGHFGEATGVQFAIPQRRGLALPRSGAMPQDGGGEPDEVGSGGQGSLFLRGSHMLAEVVDGFRGCAGVNLAPRRRKDVVPVRNQFVDRVADLFLLVLESIGDDTPRIAFRAHLRHAAQLAWIEFDEG